MFRRVMTTSVLALLLLLASVAQAFAWTNGGADPNSFGTHDFLLDRGRVLAGAEGSWLNRKVALAATDDPDTYRWSNDYQLYYESGIRRGAAQKVADLYYKAVVAYRSGDTTAASMYVGLLAHLYGDILQPFHSSYAARNMQTLHKEYEYDFGRYQRAHSTNSWVTKRTPIPVTDVRKRVISAAAYSRYRFSTLYKYFRVSHSISGPTTTVTRLMMNRGANDLADIIRTIPTEAGVAPAPTTMTAWMKHTYLAQKGTAGAFFRCLDASGAPIEGAAVIISWPVAGGSPTKVVAYTDKNGIAHDYQYIGYAPLLRRMDVIGTQTSSGKTASAQSWYMTTPELAPGSGAGIAVYLSDRRPSSETTVTAYAECRDVSGKPVAGMPVKFRWYVWDRAASRQVGPDLLTVNVVTDANGRAVCLWNTGSGRAQQEIFARAETIAAGHTRAAVANLLVQ